MAKTRSMTANAERTRARRAEKKADKRRMAQNNDRWCCENGVVAAKRGCMCCVKQLHRITKKDVTLATLSPISCRACVAAVTGGQMEILRYIFPLWLAEESRDSARVIARNLVTLAAMEGTMEIFVYLHEMYIAKIAQDTGCWSRNLCVLLAYDGSVERLMYALKHGATWSAKDRHEMASRIDFYDRASAHAECCRAAGSARW